MSKWKKQEDNPATPVVSGVFYVIAFFPILLFVVAQCQS